MAHLPDLVRDLALILITAGVVTIIFKLLKQPVVLGYIVAGFLISPHFGLLPNVTDVSNISTWSEIGVIFLLFSLGLDFSFKKLIEVGGTATIATFISMGAMIVTGYIIGQLLGWTHIESIFLGGMISMSSTIIILKAYTDMGLLKKRFSNIVLAMLIVEDLAAILMLVLLSTIAVSRHFEGADLFENVLKLLFFMVIWFIGGIYLIPTLLKKIKKYLNNETLLIISIGMCLGMVLFATSVGFSSALGAFIMGSILAETIESKHIERLMGPIKDLFGAIFFVSVGMMITPSVIVDYAGPIAILTLTVMIGMVLFSIIGVLATGEGLKVAVQAGFSLAQIGEFSFIIASLGMQLGVLSNFIYPIIVAVSVITTFTTPYFIRFAMPVYNFIEPKIPAKWNTLITGYSSNHSTVNRRKDWKQLLRKVLINIGVYSILTFAIYLLSRNFLMPFIHSYIPNFWGNLLSAVITLLLMAPFMGAIMWRKSKTSQEKKLWQDVHFNKNALIALNMFRGLICVSFVLMVLVPLFPNATGILLIISVGITVLIALSKGFKKQSRKMETRFFQNLNDKEVSEERRRVFNKAARQELSSKNIHLEEIDVPQNSPQVGKTLSELNFKQTTGVDVVSIIRGHEKINIPDGNVQLFPFDKLVVAGTDEELHEFMTKLDTHHAPDSNETEPSYQISLSQYELEPGSPLIGKTIRNSRIKDCTDCMVIGIERDGKELESVSANTVLQQDDTLWLAGEKRRLDHFEENLSDK